MKQLIKISLLLFYVFFNAGISYSLHFCEKEYKRINLYGDSKTCCESAVPMPGCCDDISNFELPNTDQKQVDAFKLVYKIPASVPVLYSTSTTELQVTALASEKIQLFADCSPPFVSKLPLYLQHNIFLI
jgi:hypothetical protein